MYINRHEWSDVIEDYKIFLNKIEEFKPYIVEFDKDNKIKLKVYPLNYVVGDNNWQPIIMITHDKYTFYANDRIWKV